MLNTVNITLSDNAKAILLDRYAKHSEDTLIKAVSTGVDGKINGDNLDLRVTTNDIRMTNRSFFLHPTRLCGRSGEIDTFTERCSTW